VLQDARGQPDLPFAFADELAHLLGQQRRELFLALEHEITGAPDHLGAFGSQALTPGVKSLVGPLHHAWDLFRFEKRELPHGLAGVGVDRSERACAGIAVRPGRCAYR
jgi:hypothetical protein